MMRRWTVLLPHFLFAWIARRQCEILNQRGVGYVVMPRPGVLLRTEPKP